MALAGLRCTAPHALAHAQQEPRSVLPTSRRRCMTCRARRRAVGQLLAAAGAGSGAVAAAAAQPAASIRQAGASDLPALIELEHLTAEGASWSPQQIEAELTRERATVLVADEGGAAVGWAVGWAVPEELHLMNVAVHPSHRRRGHARALLVALIQRHSPAAEVVLLEVRASNDPALRLYHSLGFERVGLRKQYYSDGEDAVLMTLLLRERQME